MIEHLVVFRLVESASSEAIDAIMKEIMSFKEKIPGIIDITCGTNFSMISKGFTHGVVVRFIDRTALENYFPHPVHQAMVSNLLKPILEDGLEIDYEINLAH